MMAFVGKTKKILIIVENLPVPFDRRVWMEANTLKGNGYLVSIICPKGKGYEKNYEEIDGIHIYRHWLPPEKSSAIGYICEYACALWAEWRLARKIYKRRGFDVIHACNPPDLIFLVAGWFKLLHGVKFLFDHHDLSPELYESKFVKRDIFYKALIIAERLTFLMADSVISTNESYREVAVKRGKKDLKSVHVVRSGPNLEFFNAVTEMPVYRRGRKYLVGYLGVMAEFDGVHHLVMAAHDLIKNRGHHDIHFCFIGDGPTKNDCETLSRKLGIGEFVEFTGRVSDKKMIEQLSTCDVCVGSDPLNPLNEKSTMNKILEYMALARPIVQYELCEGRRSAQDASLYAEPNNFKDLANKIEDLLANPSLREKMGKIGRERMEKDLEWRHQIPKLLRAYEFLQ